MNELTLNLANFVNSINILDKVLNSQKRLYNKVGLCFKPLQRKQVHKYEPSHHEKVHKTKSYQKSRTFGYEKK